MSDITVIDLPQPDSPTMPSVSPRSSENEMPRTACAGPRWVCRPIWRLLTSRRGIVVSACAGKARIEQVAQAVAQQVQAEHRQRDRHAGENRQQWLLEHQGLRFAEHAAP